MCNGLERPHLNWQTISEICECGDTVPRMFRDISKPNSSRFTEQRFNFSWGFARSAFPCRSRA